MTQVKIFSTQGKKFKENPENAGYDLEAVENVLIPPMGRTLVRTGVYMELPNTLQVEIRPRSGLAIKSGITVLNSPGTIDSAYRGEIGVILINLSETTFEVHSGDRIAQAVFMPVVHPEKVYVASAEDLSVTDRGAKGFGSTGVKA